MALFKKTEAPPLRVTGTAALRRLLESRSRRRALGSIANDINDSIAAASKSAASVDMARRLAGDASDSNATTALARKLADMVGDTRAVVVTGAMLEDFLKGDDLPALIKAELAALFYPAGSVGFDAEQDKLTDNAPPPKLMYTAVPPGFVNPNPAIRQAQEALRAAQAAANPPRPMMPNTGTTKSGRIPARAGFAT
ncbi:hypothetical protein ABIF68_010394 [Bradyrhizobium japonicum]|uniref:hypothetical protein n=1 Tax=Bradyrhizobium TaxID=374 RepID=UPI0004B2CA81|nr:MULTISPECIES: hypothetical protein [Bradyrhizobium]MDI2076502.1 hypothetical protein [Bradyrhizobium sp. Mp27]